MNAKLLFNSIVFFIVGIIPLLRDAPFELIVSLSFSLLFLTMLLWLRNQHDEVVLEE